MAACPLERGRGTPTRVLSSQSTKKTKRVVCGIEGPLKSSLWNRGAVEAVLYLGVELFLFHHVRIVRIKKEPMPASVHDHHQRIVSSKNCKGRRKDGGGEEKFPYLKNVHRIRRQLDTEMMMPYRMQSIANGVLLPIRF